MQKLTISQQLRDLDEDNFEWESMFLVPEHIICKESIVIQEEVLNRCSRLLLTPFYIIRFKNKFSHGSYQNILILLLISQKKENAKNKRNDVK